MPDITLQELDNLFSYHTPLRDQPLRYQAIREAGRKLAETILTNTPVSPEQTLAVRDVQRAVMMANAAIALNEKR